MGPKDLKTEITNLKSIIGKQRVDNSDSLAFQKHLDKIKECSFDIVLYPRKSNLDLIPFLQLTLADVACLGLRKQNTSEAKELPQDGNSFLLHQLNQLIGYYRKNFPGEFKMSFTAPWCYRKEMIDDQAAVIQEIQTFLRKNQLDRYLQNSLADYFYQMQFPLVDKVFTYLELESFQHLVGVLSTLIKKSNLVDFQKLLIVELVKMNFNTPLFIDFCLTILGNDDLVNWDTLKFAITGQRWFCAKTIGLYDLIDKARENHPIKDESTAESEKSLATRPYFKVSFTSRQLLFFFQVLVDTRTVITKNRTGIFDFITNHIGTVRSTQLSRGSLQRKFGKTQSLDIKKVKDQLIAMINYINYKH